MGTAATKNTGTGVGEVLAFAEAGKLPALDGSLLINLPASQAVYVPPSSVTVASSITLNSSHNNKWLLASNNITITAPASFGEFYCTIQNSGTGTITIAGITNGQGTLLLSRWQYCVVFSDGFDWYVIGDLDFRERVQDIVGNLLVAGSGISLNYNDAGNSLTITNTGGGGGSSTDITDIWLYGG